MFWLQLYNETFSFFIKNHRRVLFRGFGPYTLCSRHPVAVLQYIETYCSLKYLLTP